MCHDHWLIWCWKLKRQDSVHPSQAFYQLSYVPRPNALFMSQEHMQDITFCHHHSFNMQKLTAFQTFLLYDLEKVCVMLVCVSMQIQDTPALMQKHVGTRSRHHIPSCCSPLFFPLTKPGACYFGYTDWPLNPRICLSLKLPLPQCWSYKHKHHT